MNTLDLAIVVAGGFGLLAGLGRGLLRMLVSLIALAGGIYFAFLYYPVARDLTLKYVSVTPAVAAVIGYAAVFFIVVIIVQSAGAVLVRLVRTVNLGWIDRLAGGVAGGAITLAMVGLILMLMAAMLPADSSLLKNSQLAPSVLHYTGALLAYIPPEVKTAYENQRNELMRNWMGEALERRVSPSSRATPP
jgi:membrane protein required for colicin V production